MSTWRVRRLAPLRFTNPRAAELSVQSTIVQASNCTFCSIGLSSRFPRKLHQVPSARMHQNSDKPCSASWKTHTRDTTCFQQKLLTQTAIPELLRQSLTSPAQSASVITTTEPCGVPAIPGTSILCQFTGTHSQHVVHMHTNANVQFTVHKQTRIALILN